MNRATRFSWLILPGLIGLAVALAVFSEPPRAEAAKLSAANQALVDQYVAQSAVPQGPNAPFKVGSPFCIGDACFTNAGGASALSYNAARAIDFGNTNVTVGAGGFRAGATALVDLGMGSGGRISLSGLGPTGVPLILGSNTGDRGQVQNARGASGTTATDGPFQFVQTNGSITATSEFMGWYDNNGATALLRLLANGHLDILGTNAGGYAIGLTSGTNGICFNGSGIAGCTLGLSSNSATGVFTFTTTSGKVVFGTTAEGTMGTGSGTTPLIGTANAQSSAAGVGNGADVTEDTLFTYTLPANSLNANNKGVTLTAWGTGVSTANTLTVRCYFGATAIISKALTTSQANVWRVAATVLRTGASAEVASGSMLEGGTVQINDVEDSQPAADTTATIVIKCTGQDSVATANQILAKGFLVEAIQ